MQGGVVVYLITPPDAQHRTAVSCPLRPGVQRGGSQSRHRPMRCAYEALMPGNGDSVIFDAHEHTHT